MPSVVSRVRRRPLPVMGLAVRDHEESAHASQGPPHRSGSSYEASAASAPRRSGARLSTRTIRWPWPDSARRAATLPPTAPVIPSTMSSAVMCQVYLVSPPRSPTFGETVCFPETRRSYEPSWGRDGLSNETSCSPSRLPRHRVHESTNHDFPGISSTSVKGAMWHQLALCPRPLEGAFPRSPASPGLLPGLPRALFLVFHHLLEGL